MTFFFIQQGKRVFYVTNNSSQTREHYVKKCANYGYNAKKVNMKISSFFFSLSEILFKSMQIFKQHGFEAFNMQGVVLVRFL